MKCPLCRADLIVTGQARLETLSEHVCDPNGTPSIKDVYKCPDKKCFAYKKISWNEYGECYSNDYKSYKEFEKLLNNGVKLHFASIAAVNTAPYGSASRRIWVEVYKKDENFTLLNLYFIKWRIVYKYKADENGEILKRWWTLETLLKDKCGYILYMSGIRMLKFNFKCFYRAKKRYFENKPPWAIEDLKKDFEKPIYNKSWYQWVFWIFTNLFYKNLKREILNA